MKFFKKQNTSSISIMPLIIVLVCWLVFVWMQTLISVYLMGDYGSSFIELSSRCLLYTFAFYFYMYILFGDELSFIVQVQKSREEAKKKIHKSLLITSIIVASCFILDELRGIDLFYYSYIVIGDFTIDKEFLLYFMIIILFPIFVAYLFKRLKDTKLDKSAAMSCCGQILLFTFLEFMLYKELYTISYLLQAFIFNTVVLIMAMKKYLWKSLKRKRYAVIGFILYLIIWIVLMWYSSFLYYVVYYYSSYGLNWSGNSSSLTEVINYMKENSAFIGMNTNLTSNIYVLDRLYNTYNPILFGLFYFGWLEVIGYILLEFIFLISLKLVTNKCIKKYKDGFELVYRTIFFTFSFQVIIGLLYTFGIVPLSIYLPFSNGSITVVDSVLLSVLIVKYVRIYVNERMIVKEEENEVLVQG